MRKKATPFFSADEIKTLISLSLSCDVHDRTQEYPVMTDSTVMLQSRLEGDLIKKFVDPRAKDASLRLTALEKFRSVNRHMSDYQESFAFPDGPCRPQSHYSVRDNILIRARALMHFVLTPFDEDEWFYAAKHGSGASLGVSFADTSLEAKSRLPWTTTSRAVPLLHRYLDFDSQLKSAVIAYHGESPIGEWFRIVEGSRATTVPKTNATDRMIAVEPTGNMFLQQGLMTMMYSRMKSVGLNLASLPDQHKARARLSSVSSEEATIDWSSASDCVSRELLRWLLPPVWFDCCDQVRSPNMTIDDSLVELNMFSTMGNAVTFPLETLVFWTLAHACRLQLAGTNSCFPEWEDLLSVSVFGDDCIVPSDMAGLFIEIATSVGFIINDEKSFYGTESFRESCGGDYLCGCDVRPFYLKAPTSEKKSALEPWLYIIGNRILERYILYFGDRNYIYDREFFRTLFFLFEKYNLRVKIVPDDFPDDAGLKISQDLGRFYVNYRPNLERISVNEHGVCSFLYCSFRYWKRRDRFGDLRYWNWLKTRPRPETARNLSYLRTLSQANSFQRQYSLRKRGGYIVARGETAHWTVEPLPRLR